MLYKSSSQKLLNCRAESRAVYIIHMIQLNIYTIDPSYDGANNIWYREDKCDGINAKEDLK